MWSRLLFSIFTIWHLAVFGQLHSDSIPDKRPPSAIELEKLKQHADSLRIKLTTGATQTNPSNELMFAYLNVYDYFVKSHELVQYSQKHIRAILGAADTTFMLSRINQIVVWQYGNKLQQQYRKAKPYLYRFYFQKGALISVARVEE